ncbi:hypothetical protein HK101_001577 [Irineochytrium annulatum]|nr:hypothetical protein HK101_001577 [Irineochytrium annulatum]
MTTMSPSSTNVPAEYIATPTPKTPKSSTTPRTARRPSFAGFSFPFPNFATSRDAKDKELKGVEETVAEAGGTPVAVRKPVAVVARKVPNLSWMEMLTGGAGGRTPDESGMNDGVMRPTNPPPDHPRNVETLLSWSGDYQDRSVEARSDGEPDDIDWDTTESASVSDEDPFEPYEAESIVSNDDNTSTLAPESIDSYPSYCPLPPHQANCQHVFGVPLLTSNYVTELDYIRECLCVLTGLPAELFLLDQSTLSYQVGVRKLFITIIECKPTMTALLTHMSKSALKSILIQFAGWGGVILKLNAFCDRRWVSERETVYIEMAATGNGPGDDPVRAPPCTSLMELEALAKPKMEEFATLLRVSTYALVDKGSGTADVRILSGIPDYFSEFKNILSKEFKLEWSSATFHAVTERTVASKAELIFPETTPFLFDLLKEHPNLDYMALINTIEGDPKLTEFSRLSMTGVLIHVIVTDELWKYPGALNTSFSAVLLTAVFDASKRSWTKNLARFSFSLNADAVPDNKHSIVIMDSMAIDYDVIMFL